MSITTMPSIDIDPYSTETLTDPTSFYAALRQAGPVVKVPQSEGFDIVAIGRDPTARAVIADHDNFLNGRGGGILDLKRDEPFREPGVLQETDQPYHTRVRGVMSEIISPRHLRSLRTMFQVIAEEIVDRALEKSEFDAQVELAEAFPLRAVPDTIMGAPPVGRENLLRYSTFLFESMGPKTPRAQGVLNSIENLQDAVAWVNASAERENVSANSLGAMLWEAVDREEITAKEAGLMVRSLLGAGVDTTIYALGLTLQQLAVQPEQWALVHAAPERGKFAFEEGLRWGSPVRQIWRTPVKDTEIEGIPVAEGQKTMLALGAINQDPEHWGEDADKFDLNRDAAGHLAMGRGIHGCVGGPIARLEADVLLSTFARRVKTIEPAGDPVPYLNNTLRGWTSIPIRVAAA